MLVSKFPADNGLLLAIDRSAGIQSKKAAVQTLVQIIDRLTGFLFLVFFLRIFFLVFLNTPLIDHISGKGHIDPLSYHQ